MKSNLILHFILAAALLCFTASPGIAAEKKDKQSKLEAKARVSRTDAEKAALAKVPNGTVKEGELEKEHGKLIWSFDIATPGTKDITEVAVDAITGKVLSVDTETPEDQAKEAAEDAAKEKAGKSEGKTKHAEKDDADEKAEKK